MTKYYLKLNQSREIIEEARDMNVRKCQKKINIEYGLQDMYIKKREEYNVTFGTA